MKIAAIGEAMIELSMAGDTAGVGVAGDTLNTAIYLKRGAPELQVDYITRLGTDPFSDRIADFIASQGVGVAAVERDPTGSPGLYAISVDEDGERSFTYWRSAAAARSMFTTADGPDFSALMSYDALYLSGISMAILMPKTRAALIPFLKDYQAQGGKVVYDSNYRPRLWQDVATAQDVTAQMWALCDIALPSIDDEMDLTGETAEQVEARFLSMGTEGGLKRGPGGPLSLGSDVTQSYAAADRVVDTTAAGDSFSGGYLASRFTGGSQAQALKAGHDTAAYVIGFKGAIAPLRD